MEQSEDHRREDLAVVASFVVATASPSWGDTSPASSTTHLYRPHCNLLINMMFAAIYYFSHDHCVTIYV
jgi:hypothetical protein